MYPPNLADQFLQNNETASAVFFDTFLINFLTKNVFSAFFFLKICVSQKKAVTLHAFFARTI